MRQTIDVELTPEEWAAVPQPFGMGEISAWLRTLGINPVEHWETKRTEDGGMKIRGQMLRGDGTDNAALYGLQEPPDEPPLPVYARALESRGWRLVPDTGAWVNPRFPNPWRNDSGWGFDTAVLYELNASEYRPAPGAPLPWESNT